jgi:hypothetical protein
VFRRRRIGFQVSGIRGQRPDARKQMIKTGRKITLSDFCFLSSVICLLTPDTIDIVLFKELNWTKTNYMTFVIFL